MTQNSEHYLMLRFKPYNHDQSAMVVINYQDQLHPDTFEHAVHSLVEHKLDLSVFYPKYRNNATNQSSGLGNSHRMSVVDTGFGNIGTTKSLSRFSLRGKEEGSNLPSARHGKVSELRPIGHVMEAFGPATLLYEPKCRL